MIILGINDTHDASACLIKDGKVIFAIQEERLTRTKNIASLPINSIKFILKKYNLSANEIDLVAVATKELHNLNLWNIPGDFRTEDWRKLQEEYYYPKIYLNKKIKIRDVFPNFKPKVKLGYPIKEIPFSGDTGNKKDKERLQKLRLKYISKLLKIGKDKVKFFDHHKCHALYGYYTNPNKNLKKTILVTADGGGDRCYNSISIINNGNYKLIYKGRDNLIGVIYESITLLLGMNPTRHPYKVMGLAPYTSEYNKKDVRKILLNSLKLSNYKFIKNKQMKDNFIYFKNKLRDYRFDGIAGGLQDFVEIRLVQLFKNLSKKFKIQNFIFSGGVANNVKANKVLSEKNFVKSIFIPPGPGDESISIGACYCALQDIYGPKTIKYIKVNDTAYWGNDIEKKNHDMFKKNSFVKKNFYSKADRNMKYTAEALARGEIVFFCQGRMEFGSRALGHRSILSDPSKISQIQKINDTIKKRDFWMPFTPSIIDTDYNKYVKNHKKINSSFMTICFDSTKIARSHLAAAIHPYDNTIRPQKVTKKTCEKYYKLIKQFKKLTGIGALLNTSLNVHDKPIINQPTDILKEILDSDASKIKYIFIEDTLYIKKTKN